MKEALAELHLPISVIAPYMDGAARLILLHPTHDEVDGFLCEGRRLLYALHQAGPPLRRYYKWPLAEADIEKEEVCQVEQDPATGLIKVQWLPFRSFLP